MEIRPILSALLRNKTGPILVAVQVALSLGILANALHIVQVRQAVSARASGLANEADVFTVQAAPPAKRQPPGTAGGAAPRNRHPARRAGRALGGVHLADAAVALGQLHRRGDRPQAVQVHPHHQHLRHRRFAGQDLGPATGRRPRLPARRGAGDRREHQQRVSQGRHHHPPAGRETVAGRGQLRRQDLLLRGRRRRQGRARGRRGRAAAIAERPDRRARRILHHGADPPDRRRRQRLHAARRAGPAGPRDQGGRGGAARLVADAGQSSRSRPWWSCAATATAPTTRWRGCW